MDEFTKKYFKQAFYQAYLGLGSTSPNPSVGAVVVKNGKVIGKGHTMPPPGSHAEVVAIESATESVEGSTMFVTLEPCSFHGRTPSCAKLIVESKIKKVYIASLDPHPKVAGKGVEILKDAGIEVEVGLLQEQAEYLHRFFFFSLQNEIPYITLKAAQTLDGFVARDNGNSKWISNAMSRRNTHRQRGFYDAILVGFNTLISDNPTLNVRMVTSKSEPIRVVLWTRKGVEIDLEHYNIISENGAKTIIIYTKLKESYIQKYSSDDIIFIKAELNNGEVDLFNVLKQLKDKFNILSLFVEGGAAVLSNFYNQSLFNELLLYVAPKIFGHGISIFKNTDEFDNLSLYKSRRFGDDINLIYRRK